ncbi:MAG: DEAD/DEAH box helicase, partial [Oscillospiraceae bacterium]|nr:DEAD/DEAH box helicase [Oscillospiraceae bacterium]
MDAFERYAPFIQEYIYRSGWEKLRAVQVAAADAIFNTEDNVLISASTASGKTEAAFFPVLTLLEENPPASVGAIYIAPLKALINDQFSRMTELCEPADIKVWRWHGDVGQSQKAKLLKNPSGILQITPESLEALMLHKHAMIPALFRDLRFVIIDEVHSLLRGDRGGQTLCLIERLSDLSGAKPRRIGLSATIGDIEQTAEYLGTGSGRNTVIPQIAAQKSTWRLSMEHFYAMDTQAAEGKEVDAPEPLEQETDRAPNHADPAYGYIFSHTQGKKCLVFVNSREECEAVTTSLRQYCEWNDEPDRFLIHHGNLSAAIRETAEAVMKDEEQILTTVTTATLELGIDIGQLERAFQLDAPCTVSSFLQRMGRTGRRGLPPEMWFVMREEEPEARAMLPSTVP